jgi:WD40 repeat protein
MGASFDPSGTFIAVAGEPTVVVNLRSGDKVRAFKETWSSIVEWSPDGASIAIASVGGGGGIFDAHTGRQRSALLGRGAVDDLAFSADGSMFAAASSTDGSVRIWDADTGEQQLVLHSPHGSRVDTSSPEALDERARSPDSGVLPGIAFSPDGAKLIQASADGPVWIWPLDLDELMQFVNAGLTRTLTDDECQQYLHLDRCP